MERKPDRLTAVAIANATPGKAGSRRLDSTRVEGDHGAHSIVDDGGNRHGHVCCPQPSKQ
ncbi:MAG: hypothetical protein V4505_22700 [Pseudomonadota bacterium]